MTLTSEKLARRSLVVLIGYVGLSGMSRAASKFFWCDEVITVTLSRLPTLDAIWQALAHAADSHPPLFYVSLRRKRFSGASSST